MALEDLLNNVFGEDVISYPFEVDEEQDALILKNDPQGNEKKSTKFIQSFGKSNHSIIWINNPQYRFNLEALQAYNKLFLGDIPIFISSCSPELVPLFREYKFEILKVGKEAILDLSFPHLNKRSIKEMIRSGKKYGSAKEIYYSDEISNKLEKFKKIVHTEKSLN